MSCCSFYHQLPHTASRIAGPQRRCLAGVARVPNPPSVTPMEKLPERLSIGGAGIFVSDMGCEKLYEAPRGFGTFAGDQEWSGGETGAGEFSATDCGVTFRIIWHRPSTLFGTEPGPRRRPERPALVRDEPRTNLLSQMPFQVIYSQTMP